MIIYTDNIGIEQEKKRMQNALDKLHEFKDLATALLGELNESELKNIPTRAKVVVLDNLKGRFPYPNGDVQTNYDLLGIHPKNLLDHLDKNAKYWHSYIYNYEDGKYNIVDPESYFKPFKTYADTEEKKKLYELYTTIATAFNEIADMGVNPSVIGLMKAFPTTFENARVKESVRTPFIKIDNERLAEQFRTLEMRKRKPLHTSTEILNQIKNK